MEHEVYLGLGGNIGDTLTILQSALQQIQKLNVADFKTSRFYHTQPISDMEQRWYVNAACRFKTTMEARELLVKMQQIEIAHGKGAKPKNAPRVIDIDILFFGRERHHDVDCEIPHPRWKERLFVIKPLLDLTETIAIPGINHSDDVEHVNLTELIQTFPNQAICKLLI
jgi:2-amino-4-hydroxy-6-hydroxymethyldihydropteridine diphosphokinase